MMAAPSPLAATDPFEGIAPGSESALTAFDSAFQPFEPDEALLSGTPARSLAEAMADFVSAITRMDIDRVIRRDNWWSRFTGADLEVRLELEVAAQRFTADMERLAQAASDARNARASMKVDINRLAAVGPAHESLAARTVQFLRNADREQPSVARLQRRLANLETIIASNRLVGAQMTIAIEHLSGLLDRYADIEKRLFPVWRHHALAVAQSARGATDPKSVEQLRAVRKHFTMNSEPSGTKAP